MLSLFKKLITESKKLIYSDAFRQKHRLGNGFSRRSKLSFLSVMYFILAQEYKAISINLSNLQNIFPLSKIPYVSKQAVSKARQKLSSNAFQELCLLFPTYITHKEKMFLYGMDFVYMQWMALLSRYLCQKKTLNFGEVTLISMV